ncbi:unnamed protein product, partial [Meganyctiphanes norvegica]
MKMATHKFACIILSVILIIDSGYSASIKNKDVNRLAPPGRGEATDCRVHQKHIWENLTKEDLTFIAFIEYGEVLSCKITFQGQNKHFVYDRLVISHEEVKLHKVRNGNVNKTTSNKFIDTAGWTRIEISMTTNQFTLKYWNNTCLEYTVDQPVDKLFLHGSNISICKD